MKLYTQLPAFRKRVSVAVFLFSSQLPGGCALRARACGSADRIVADLIVPRVFQGWGVGCSCRSHSPALPLQGGLFDLIGNVLYGNRKCSFISKQKPIRFNWLMQKKKKKKGRGIFHLT